MRISKSGMTLVEIMATLVLLAIVVISAFSAYVYISTYTVRADNYAAATEFLCQTLETLSACAYGDSLLSITTGLPPNTNSNPPPDHYDDTLPPGNLRDRYGGVRQYWVSEALWDANYPDSYYKNITVSVSWNDGADRTLTLSMRKTK